MYKREIKSYRWIKNHRFTNYKFTNYSNQLGRLLRNSSRKLNSTSQFSSPVWKPTKMYQQKWLKGLANENTDRKVWKSPQTKIPTKMDGIRLKQKSGQSTLPLNEKIDSGNTHLQDIPKIRQFYWHLSEQTRFFLCFHIIKSSKKPAKIEPKYLEIWLQGA